MVDAKKFDVKKFDLPCKKKPHGEAPNRGFTIFFFANVCHLFARAKVESSSDNGGRVKLGHWRTQTAEDERARSRPSGAPAPAKTLPSPRACFGHDLRVQPAVDVRAAYV